MSKSKSRGWLQVVAKNPSANPQTDPSIWSERSNAAILSNRRRTEGRDWTKFPVAVQFEAVSRNIVGIQRHLAQAVRKHQPERARKLTRLLADQQSRLEVLADKVAKMQALEPVPVDHVEMWKGHIVRPDLTVNYAEMVRKYGPQQKRWGQDYYNGGKVVRAKKEVFSF